MLSEKLKKFAAILKNAEAEEHQAAQLKKKIEEVLDSRKSKLAEVEARRSKLLEKLAVMMGEKRYSALNSGDISRVASITGYRERLEREILEVEREFETQNVEVNRAIERAKMAEDDLLEARIERRKIEQLVTAEEQSERLKKVALEEINTDELNSSRRGKR